MQIKYQVVVYTHNNYIHQHKEFYYNPSEDLSEIFHYISQWLTSPFNYKIEITKWNAKTGEKLV